LSKNIYTKKVAPEKIRCLSKNIFTKKGGMRAPSHPHYGFYVGVLPFIRKLKKGLPDKIVKRRKVTIFKKAYTSVVMYKLVEGGDILYIKNRKCQIM
jgi:hypothetical protein